MIAGYLIGMAHSRLRNYILPGLNSHLLSQPSSAGCVRLFEATRWQDRTITPHSHRFNLVCQVLEGSVENTQWVPRLPKEDGDASEEDDYWQVSNLKYGGEPGQYVKSLSTTAVFDRKTTLHNKGDWYSMSYSDIHSIVFSKGAVVLLFEGQVETFTTQILEPFVDGTVCTTFQVQPWMFKKAPT